jgi:peptidase E
MSPLIERGRRGVMPETNFTLSHQMKLFLASALDKMKDQLLAEVGSLQSKKIAYITNPADDDIEREWNDLRWIKNDRDMLISCGAELVPLDLRVVQGEELKEILMSCDMIYVSWWNNDYFLKLAKQSGYADFLPELVREHNKVYLSTSAGSCVMGNFVCAYTADGSLAKLIPGYWFYAMMLVPHRWGGSESSKIKKLRHFEEHYVTATSFLTLTDFQAIIVDEHGMRIVTNTQEEIIL